MGDHEDFDDLNEKWSMIQSLLLAFMSEHTKESLEELRDKFEKWADSKTEEELAAIIGDDAIVKKVYKNLETKENLHTEEDIIRSMFKNIGQNGNKHI
jgi:hypothetical protein